MIFVNNNWRDVGIGTTDPSEALDVVGDVMERILE
jgi:hypothetical protein